MEPVDPLDAFVEWARDREPDAATRAERQQAFARDYWNGRYQGKAAQQRALGGGMNTKLGMPRMDQPRGMNSHVLHQKPMVNHD